MERKKRRLKTLIKKDEIKTNGDEKKLKRKREDLDKTNGDDKKMKQRKDSTTETPKKRRRKGEDRPTLYQRLSENEYVKIVCPTCGADTFSNLLGFVNHCRIVHELKFPNLSLAARHCGQPVPESVVPLNDPCRASVLLDVQKIRSQAGLSPEEDSTSRFYIKKRITVGNTSLYIPPEKRDAEDVNTHKWMVWVVGPNDEPSIIQYIKKVRFYLHESFKPNDRVDLVEPAFHLKRRGWGEFPIRIVLYFKDARNKPVHIVHNLKLDQKKTGLQTDGGQTVTEIELLKVQADTPIQSVSTPYHDVNTTIEHFEESDNHSNDNNNISLNNTNKSLTNGNGQTSDKNNVITSRVNHCGKGPRENNHNNLSLINGNDSSSGNGGFDASLLQISPLGDNGGITSPMFTPNPSILSPGFNYSMNSPNSMNNFSPSMLSPTISYSTPPSTPAPSIALNILLTPNPSTPAPSIVPNLLLTPPPSLSPSLSLTPLSSSYYSYYLYSSSSHYHYSNSYDSYSHSICSSCHNPKFYYPSN